MPNEMAKETVEYLLKQLQRLEIEVKCLYLDRGFGSIEIARYLKEIKQTAIIACQIRGKTGGLRALCVGTKSYRTSHLFKSEKHGAEEGRNGDVQGIYNNHEKRQEGEKSEMVGIYFDWM